MKRVIALGFFDGVHLGHAALLNKARQEADARGCKAAALTFDHHPDEVIFGRKTPLLNTLPEREQLMKGCFGMDEVLTLPFDAAMMQMPWEQFAEDVLCGRFEAEAVVCGHDFTFGYKGEGNAERLREKFGSCCHVIEAVELDGETVSSTCIRALLQQGKVERANRMLGRNHFLTGEVIHGKQLGRRLGTPTANILLQKNVLAPAFGVYAARLDGKPAVTNIGVRPTVDDGETVTVESWIMDYDGDLYGKTVKIELLHFLRPERKFSTVQALKEQILRDGETVKDLLK